MSRLDGLKPIKPGEVRNPLGRHNPAKRTAGEKCWAALRDDFEVNGVAAIEAMREANPVAYVQLIASGLPAEKAIDLNVRTAESLHDEQARMIAESYLETVRRATAGAEGSDSVHAELPAGLPTG